MKKRFILLTLILLFAAGIGGYCYYETSNIYSECFMEAGVSLSPGDFLKRPVENAVFDQETASIDTRIPGDYPVTVKAGFFTLHGTLHIQDTIEPELETKSIVSERDKVLPPDAFIRKVEDATELSVSYEEEPDFSALGDQKVSIKVEDLGGNVAVSETTLTIIPIYTEVTLEAGSPVPEASYFTLGPCNATLRTDLSELSFDTVTDYPVSVEVDGKKYQSLLHVIDTTAPAVTTKDLDSYTTISRIPEDFIESAEDATTLQYEFKTAPDIQKEGKQEVVFTVTDEGGNETVCTAFLTLQSDHEPPVLSGVAPLQAMVGDPIAYKKGITVTDNCEEGLTLLVDNSKVDVNTEGTYPVIYTARDASGNEVSEETTITINPRRYDEGAVYAAADQIIASIIHEGMSGVEKVRAIYNYVTRNITFIEHAEKVNLIQGAYAGLIAKKGDCFSFACASKVLFDRAGIHNEFISKVPPRPTSSHHYWNIVNVGDGWYHFDATPRHDHPVIFMWTDSQLTAYSDMHHNSHNYDRSLYSQVVP
ncbi:MAG: hypothetical protein E7300_05815 [Lachnospiraceae bacterium]|nr:hypothetical protein [Lachnospiraceae bacterium]